MVRKVLACKKCHRRFISEQGIVRCDVCRKELPMVDQAPDAYPYTNYSVENDEIHRETKRLKTSVDNLSDNSRPNSKFIATPNEPERGESLVRDSHAAKVEDIEQADNDSRMTFETKKEDAMLLPEGSSNADSSSEDDDEEFTLAEFAAMSQKNISGEPESSVVLDQTILPELLASNIVGESFYQVTSTVELPGDICLVCGSNFERTSGIKGRLNHIKRCSKKHGFSGRDTVVEEQEEIVKSAHLVASAVHGTNPYCKLAASWHEQAETELSLAATEAVDTKGSLDTRSSETVQTTLKNFFHAPVRSLNKVLLLGARRVAKASEILKTKKTKRVGSWGGNFMKSDHSNCPAYKRITGTDFNVDGFMYAQSSRTKNYWLTHFHSDHYGGITKDWNCGTIYCSLPTANLVNQQLGVEKKWLHPIPMYTPTVVESSGRPITVTLLDANHCPGAVMFLFEVGKRRILHVGDFRWNAEIMLQQQPLKKLFANQHRLDELYLDTTYCDEKYCLPTQNEAIQACIEVAVRENARPGKTLFLFGAYTIGKERIYLSVAERLGMRVCVDKNRMKVLQALDLPKEQLNILTTEREETCLWVVPLGHINFRKMGSYVDMGSKVFSTRTFDRVVGFRPTGWAMTSGKGAGLVSTRTSGAFTVHGVAYSEHSSFPELIECLDCLKPKKIVPTVSVNKSQEQIELLLTALRRRREHQNMILATI